MPAPTRISNGVYVLVPFSSDVGLPTIARTARQACRAAWGKGLTPLFPLFICGAYMSDEELDKELRTESFRWLARSSRIWVCGPDSGDEPIALDPLSYRILIHNEGLLGRGRRKRSSRSCLPVHRFTNRVDGEFEISLLTRDDIGIILRCNLVDGLFHGAAA